MESAAEKPCSICDDKWGYASCFCSGGAHWIRAILSNEMTCAEKCGNIAYVGYMGQAYCPEHYKMLPEEAKTTTHLISG
jgi:hypothetical protein